MRHTIAELDLSSNILGSHEIRRNSIDLNRETAGEAVGKLLRDPRCSIETLKLSWNMIRFKSGTELVGALRENQRITYLDISYNGLGVDGGEALGNALHYNKSLIVLKLGHNNITARACCTILSGVRSCLTLKEVDLTENPIGQEGARALLAMNIHEGHRLSMDFSGCSLRLKDPTCWFDPSKPVNSFSLDLCKPYERSVCIELLRLAAEHDNLKIESFKYCSQEEPTLEKELMLSVYSSKDNPDFKNDVRNSLKSQDQDKIYEIASDIESARNLFRQAADKIFRQYDTDESESLDREELSHLLTQLGLESSKPVINKLIDTYDTDGSGRVEEDEFIFFLLDVKDTYEKTQSWTKDTRYIYLVDDPTQNLRKDLVGTPKPFMPADDGKVIIEIRGERTLPEFIHTISKQDVETMLMSSKTVADSGAIFEYALTVMQLKYQEAKSFYRILLKESGSSFAVLRRLLPRVATPSDVRLLLSSVAYQDFSKIHNLKMALGMLYRVYIGLPNGFYRLNLADTVDRYCLQRLIEINNTNSHQRIGLRKGATSQSGNWTNFRNTLVDGIPFTITKEWLTAEPPTKGKIEFDFVSVQEIPLSFPSISNLRLFRVLAALDMTSDDTRAKVLDKLSISAEEGRFAAKASGYRKWEVANTYALEAARHLQTLYDTVDNSRPMRILKDISTEEVVFLDIAKSPRELLDSDQAG